MSFTEDSFTYNSLEYPDLDSLIRAVKAAGVAEERARVLAIMDDVWTSSSHMRSVLSPLRAVIATPAQEG